MSGAPDAAALVRFALEAGFSQAALCRADAFDAERRRVQSGPPIAERRQLRFDPLADDARARSLLVMLWAYRPSRAPSGGRVFVDGYYAASNAAYRAAKEVARRAQEAGVFARANVNYPAREAAVRAGLGVIGDNGLLITKRFGSRVAIQLIACGVPAPEREAQPAETCLRCGRCAMACPACAIEPGGARFPERCLRNTMLEGVVVPEALRERMGLRLLGCDVCQRVCPMQPPMEEEESGAPPLSCLVTADEAAFTAAVRRLGEQVGPNMARPQRVRAQAALLTGNLRDAALLPALREWSESAHEAVREHARWAVRRIEEREKQS